MVVDLPRWGPMLSPRVLNLVPIPGPRMEPRNPWSAPTTELWAPTPTGCHADHTVPDTCGTTYTDHRTGGGSQGATQHIDYATPPCLPEFCQNGVEVPALNADRVPGVSDAEWRRDIENLRRIVETYANDTSCLAGDTAQIW